MRISLVAIGRSMPDWIERGWYEYARRLPRDRIDLQLEALPAPRGRGDGKTREREGRALLQRCPKGATVIALDGAGEPWETRVLAQRLEGWMMRGVPVALLVGGAEGLSDHARDASAARWSLGPLTLPHMMVRVIVAEQIYRAWTLLSGHPYHRG
jgi:23S rRNA (pseudouridine1915-N3)-methyltransferase